jgi:hypothetical protein
VAIRTFASVRSPSPVGPIRRDECVHTRRRRAGVVLFQSVESSSWADDRCGGHAQATNTRNHAVPAALGREGGRVRGSRSNPWCDRSSRPRQRDGAAADSSSRTLSPQVAELPSCSTSSIAMCVMKRVAVARRRASAPGLTIQAPDNGRCVERAHPPWQVASVDASGRWRDTRGMAACMQRPSRRWARLHRRTSICRLRGCE